MCFGATISCRYNRCSKKYHYPCASGSGCFQVSHLYICHHRLIDDANVRLSKCIVTNINGVFLCLCHCCYNVDICVSGVGMSIDIRKSGYRISGSISGYENSQTISENNK